MNLEMNPGTLMQSLKTRWWVLVSLPLIATVIALVITELQEPVYSANARLLIDYRMPLEGELAGEILPVGLQESYVATQMEIIGSRRVAEKVVAMLGLENTPGWQDDYNAQREIGQSFSSWATDTLMDGLQLTIGKDSRLVDVWYSDSDPEFAARVANAFVDAYRDLNKQLEHNPAKESAKSVEFLLAGLRGKLEDAEHKLSKYQQRTGIVDTNEQLDVETGLLKDLAEQGLEAETRLREAESRLAALDQFMADGGTPDALPQSLQNDLIQRMQIEIMTKEAELAEMSLTLGKRHPQLQKLKADLTSMRTRLAEEAARLVEGVRQELLEVRNFAVSARRTKMAQKEKVLDLKNARDGLQPLLREVESARASYDRSLLMYNEYAIHGHLNRTNVAILDRAVPPVLPSAPNVMYNLGSALLGGLILAIGLVISWEAVDRRIRSREDMLYLDVAPYLGELPRA